MAYATSAKITQSNLLNIFSRIDDFFMPKKLYKVSAYYTNEIDITRNLIVPAKYGSYELFSPLTLIIGEQNNNILLNVLLFFREKSPEKFAFAINQGNMIAEIDGILYIGERNKYAGYHDDQNNYYRDKVYCFSEVHEDVDYLRKVEKFKSLRSLDISSRLLDDTDDEE